MSRSSTLQECDHAVTDLVADAPRPEQKALAALVCGVVFGKTATLSVASAAMPGTAKEPSKLRRTQRLLGNPRLDVSRAQRRLLARVVAGHRGRLELLLDASSTGITTHYAGTETMCLSFAWHGRCIPLLWRSRRRGKGATPSWQQVTAEFIAQLLPIIPAETQVVLMADRGLTGRPLLVRLQQQGWHYILRSARTTLMKQEDSVVQPLSDLVPSPGAPSRFLTDVRIFAPRHKRAKQDRQVEGQSNWYRVWSRALTTNVVAVWRAEDKDPWLLLTDLPATPARCTEYRRRMWQEEGFRDWKSFGWNWQKSRVRVPERVDRLLLILALATLWMAVLAQHIIRRGYRPLLEPRTARCYSYFQLSLHYVARLLSLDCPIHCSLHFRPEPRAPLKLS